MPLDLQLPLRSYPPTFRCTDASEPPRCPGIMCRSPFVQLQCPVRCCSKAEKRKNRCSQVPTSPYLGLCYLNTPFSISYKTDLVVMTSLSFCLSGSLYFSFISEGWLCQIEYLGGNFDLSALGYVILLSFHLYSFCQEICWEPNGGSFVGDTYFFPLAFFSIFLYFDFW